MYEKLLFNNPHGQSLPYLKYTPKTPPSDDGYPLMVFMHGYGERGPADGSEVDLVAKHGTLLHLDQAPCATQQNTEHQKQKIKLFVRISAPPKQAGHNSNNERGGQHHRDPKSNG